MVILGEDVRKRRLNNAVKWEGNYFSLGCNNSQCNEVKGNSYLMDDCAKRGLGYDYTVRFIALILLY